jgi:uncharacterized protein
VNDWNDPDLTAWRDSLVANLGASGRVAVAFSGGVDSAVVARAAFEALGDRAVAVTAVSDSLAEGEREGAEALAREIGIRHLVIETREFEDPNYLRNAPDRCYFCKSELYGRLATMRDELGVDVVVSGANRDDTAEWRPGLQAAAENGVRHPLQECGLGKTEVRFMARAWGLPTWDKPASPCLSSRVAYGEAVTPERVKMIDEAERWLRARGLPIVRVRYHNGDVARVEVPSEELPRLASAEFREAMVRAFRDLGFKFVTLDLEGFRSGSLNALLPVESLMRPAGAGANGKGRKAEPTTAT